MMIALLADDIVTGRADGLAAGPFIPPDLAERPDAHLRWDGERVIALDNNLRDYWIDDLGLKHIQPGDGRQKLRCRRDDELIVEAGVWRVRSVADALAQARAAAQALVVGYADRLTARITAAYPAAEVASWPTREAEARAIVAGEALPEGALLTALAAAAGQTPAAYAARILAKAAAYRQIVVAVTVIREAAQAAIAAATTPAAIEAALAAVKAQADQRAQELGLGGTNG